MKYIMPMALLLSACMPPATPPKHPEGVDERLWTAVHTFEQAFDVEVTIDVSVKDLSEYDRLVESPPVYATCAYYGDRSVRIDPRSFNKGWAFLEMRVWHELGHCVFGLRHVSEPCSIMRAFGGDTQYSEHFKRDRECFIEHMRGMVE